MIIEIEITSPLDKVLTEVASMNGKTEAEYAKGIVEVFLKDQYRGLFTSQLKSKTDTELEALEDVIIKPKKIK